MLRLSGLRSECMNRTSGLGESEYPTAFPLIWSPKLIDGFHVGLRVALQVDIIQPFKFIFSLTRLITSTE
jgi:hypothetical protein